MDRMMVMTEAGTHYLAKLQTGADPAIAGAVAAVGPIIFDKESLKQMTGAIGETYDMDVGPKAIIDKHTVRLDLMLTNEKLEESILITHVVVYVNDPDDGKIPYYVAAYRIPQPLSSMTANYGVIDTFELQMNLTFLDSDKVPDPITPGWLVSRKEFTEYQEDVAAQLSNKAQREDSEWIYPELPSGVESTSGSPVRYRRKSGITFLEGWVDGASINLVLFTLPVGFAPGQTLDFVVSQSSSSSVDLHRTGRLSITPNGEVRMTRADDRALLETAGVSLNVSFSPV